MPLSPVAHTPSCMGIGAQWHQPTIRPFCAQWHRLPPLTHRYIPWLPLPIRVSLQVVSLTLFGQTGRYLYEMTLCKREKERLPARMNFDQSEDRKFSLWDCHGCFLEREFWHQTNGKDLIYICPNCTRKPYFITVGTSSKSWVFMIQLTCSMSLSLRADSSRTDAPCQSADESTRPRDINKPDSRVSKH